MTNMPEVFFKRTGSAAQGAGGKASWAARVGLDEIATWIPTEDGSPAGVLYGKRMDWVLNVSQWRKVVRTEYNDRIRRNFRLADKVEELKRSRPSEHVDSLQVEEHGVRLEDGTEIWHEALVSPVTKPTDINYAESVRSRRRMWDNHALVCPFYTQYAPREV